MAQKLRHCLRWWMLALAVLAVCTGVGLTDARPTRDSAQPATAQAPEAEPSRATQTVSGSEPLLWAHTLATVMSTVKRVSWKVFWEDVGLDGVVSPATALADNPTLRGKEPNMMKLVDCLNSVYAPNSGKYTSWQRALHDVIDDSTFRVVAAWWSNHDPTSPITAVTSSSVNRLVQLYSQCKSWNGPLSATLIVPLVADGGDGGAGLSSANKATLLTAVVQVARFVSDMQAARNVCKPDVILVYEMFANEASSVLLYPLNIPRNFARLQARTPLIAEVDIDLVVAHAVSARFQDPAASQALLDEAMNKTAFIIPAFDILRTLERAAWADALVSYDKEMMVYAYNKGIAYQFDVRGYPQGHNISNYPYWITAREDYATTHGHMAEPWFVGPRLLLPWHDDRYRGYGKDKVQFVEDTHYKGFQFKVLHDGFVIHRAHKKGEAANLYLKQLKNAQAANGGQKPQNLYTHYNALYQQQCTLQEAGKPFTAPLHAATLACQRALPWWLGAPSLEPYQQQPAAEQAAPSKP